MLNEGEETTVDYVVHRHGTPMLDLTDESTVGDEDTGQCDLGDFNSHHEDSKANEEDSAEKIEAS